MKSVELSTIPRRGSRLFALLLVAAATASAATAGAAMNEDSLVCAKVKDSYAVAAYTAAFWPRSAAYGDMTWCNMKVQAIEHCVPAEAVLLDTTAPWEGYRGPELANEFTCYKIRCVGNEGSSYMGSTVTIDDTYGARRADKPRVTRICLPDK